MGEAKRRKDDTQVKSASVVKLTRLSQPNAKNSPLLRNAGEQQKAAAQRLVLNAFRAEVGGRSFAAGFAMGTGERFTAIGVAVVDRIVHEAAGKTIAMAPITGKDDAFGKMMRTLGSFEGEALVFCFADFASFNAGMADLFHSGDVSVFDERGSPLKRLTALQHKQMKSRGAPAGNARQEIFSVSAPNIKMLG
jgi:hypothetical protein